MVRILRCVIITAALASFAFRASASLIDLGERDLPSRLPGQAAAIAYIENDQGLPPGTLTYLNAYDVDGGAFANNGAVDSSNFGVTIINGGVNGNVSWDLSTSGFQLSYVFLKDGRNSTQGPYLYHLYGVTPDQVFNSMGDQFVTINGVRFITYISFFGVPGAPSVPEGGTTLALLGLALGGIELFRRTLRRAAPRI